jgi:amidase
MLFMSLMPLLVSIDYNDGATRDAVNYIPCGGYKQFLNAYGLPRKRLGIVRNPFFTSGGGSLQAKAFVHHFQTIKVSNFQLYLRL